MLKTIKLKQDRGNRIECMGFNFEKKSTKIRKGFMEEGIFRILVSMANLSDEQRI